MRSWDYDFIGVRGANDPVNLDAYAPYRSSKYKRWHEPRMDHHEPGYTRTPLKFNLTADMVEKAENFTSGYSSADEQNRLGKALPCHIENFTSGYSSADEQNRLGKALPCEKGYPRGFFGVEDASHLEPLPLAPKSIVYRDYMERQQCKN